LFSQEDSIDVAKSLNLEIHDINFRFKNTESFKTGDLEALIESPKSEYLNLQTLDLDVRRLDKFYFDNGYFDAIIDTNISIAGKNKIAPDIHHQRK
jgi:Surface antigen variable number repeat.